MNSIHINTALLATGWANDVVIDIGGDGNISRIQTDIAGAAPGCLLPGIANLHSHAHQRAMAGLAERAGAGNDSFWTWRTTMYAFLDAIQPHHLHAIASQLYLEMLKAGYTRVAEFQYLHHQANGSQYDNIAEMSLQTLAAARGTGLGITSLPVHYQYGGFGAQSPSEQQRRFVNDPEDYLTIVDALVNAGKNDNNAVTGLSAHSLRAVTKESFGEVLRGCEKHGQRPIHIHIAEQTKEVDDCVSWCNARPVEYLFDSFKVDARWCLIHVTHMTEDETSQLARSGAVAGLCPTTEGNLGDGFFNATQYFAENGKLGIGSDSHISISPTEELRWFEYGQRLLHRSRNQLAGGFNRSTGRNLFDTVVAGGAQACGHNSGAIDVGKRADFVVLDTRHPLLCERSGDELIDSWVFSGNATTVRDVYVGGRKVIDGGHHAQEQQVEAQFRSALKQLRNL